MGHPQGQVIVHTNLYWAEQTAPGRTAGTVETQDVDFGGSTLKPVPPANLTARVHLELPCAPRDAAPGARRRYLACPYFRQCPDGCRKIIER
jgi:hypothetical protein